MQEVKVQFSRDNSCELLKTLRERVNIYFKNAGKSPKANIKSYLKAAFMMSVVASTYFVILQGFGGVGTLFVLYAFLGLSIAIATMNIAHDALHGAYLSSQAGNRVLGFFMDLFGAISFYWKKEHTIDHHTFTNIDGHDADLDVPFLLRISPEAPRRSFHRFQQWYAPFLYALNLIRWVFVSDTKRIMRVLKNRETSPGKPSRKEVAAMIIFKFVHFFVFLGLPMILLPFSAITIAAAYLVMLAIAGLTLTVIFQLAHIVEEVDFPVPSDDGKMAHSFAKHQLATTANFGSKHGLSTFLFGGLNFQVEHHLFPHICHTHLPYISKIVQKTAQEFGVKYHHKKSFFAAIKSHFSILKHMGRVS